MRGLAPLSSIEYALNVLASWHIAGWSDAPSSYSTAMKNSWAPAHELPGSVEIHLDPKMFFGAIHLLHCLAAASLLLLQDSFC